MSNKKAKYKTHFQKSWLCEPEYSKWLRRDKNDNTLAFSTVCHWKKALVLHASREFHKSRLPTSSQTTVKFVKDEPKKKKTLQKIRMLLVPQVLVPVPAPLRGILQPKLWHRILEQWVLRQILCQWCLFEVWILFKGSQGKQIHQSIDFILFVYIILK